MQAAACACTCLPVCPAGAPRTRSCRCTSTPASLIDASACCPSPNAGLGPCSHSCRPHAARACMPAALTTSFSAASSATSSKGSCCESWWCAASEGGGRRGGGCRQKRAQGLKGRPKHACRGSYTAQELHKLCRLPQDSLRHDGCEPRVCQGFMLKQRCYALCWRYPASPARWRCPRTAGVVVLKVGVDLAAAAVHLDVDRLRVHAPLSHPVCDALFQHIDKPVAAGGGLTSAAQMKRARGEHGEQPSSAGAAAPAGRGEQRHGLPLARLAGTAAICGPLS